MPSAEFLRMGHIVEQAKAMPYTFIWKKDIQRWQCTECFCLTLEGWYQRPNHCFKCLDKRIELLKLITPAERTAEP